MFVKEGARVALADIDVNAGAAAVASIDSPAALFIPCDVSSAESVRTAITETEKSFGKLDIIFNNAGIMHIEDAGAVNTDECVWELTMAINAKGVFYGCKFGIPALQRAGGGSIINTASFVTRMGAATPQIACKLEIAFNCLLLACPSRYSIKGCCSGNVPRAGRDSC